MFLPAPSSRRTFQFRYPKRTVTSLLANSQAVRQLGQARWKLGVGNQVRQTSATRGLALRGEQGTGGFTGLHAIEGTFRGRRAPGQTEVSRIQLMCM